MNNLQDASFEAISGNFLVAASGKATNAELATKVSAVINYLKKLVDEIENRVADGSRSIFDFADLAIIVSALVYYNDGKTTGETERYKDFVQVNLLPNAVQDEDLIATAFYCLMRCGIVHEMSLSAHGISNKNQMTLSGFVVYVTHDSSKGDWFSIDRANKAITFYMPQLLGAVKKCLDNATDATSDLWSGIASILKYGGINIITVKK